MLPQHCPTRSGQHRSVQRPIRTPTGICAARLGTHFDTAAASPHWRHPHPTTLGAENWFVEAGRTATADTPPAGHKAAHSTPVQGALCAFLFIASKPSASAAWLLGMDLPPYSAQLQKTQPHSLPGQPQPPLPLPPPPPPVSTTTSTTTSIDTTTRSNIFAWRNGGDVHPPP